MGNAWFEVYRSGQGVMAIMPYPRLDAGHANSIDTIAAAGYSLIVSLLANEEAESLGLLAEEQVAIDQGLEFRSCPIPDFGVPHRDDNYVSLIRLLCQRLNQGDRILLHCRGGVGRSGMTAAAVRVACGESPEQACSAVSEARGRLVPETESQNNWLLCAYENRILVFDPD